MNCNDYTITMPYKEFKKWQSVETELNTIKDYIISCYNAQDNDIMYIDVTKLKNAGKNLKLLPTRYENYNYQEVR